VTFCDFLQPESKNDCLENYICIWVFWLSPIPIDQAFSTLCVLWPLQSWQFQLTVLQPLGWRCVKCAIHHKQDVHKRDVLCTCRSGFPIATKWCCDQDVKAVPGATFTKSMRDRCGSLWKEGILLQRLCWHCFVCAIHHEWDVREEQHPYISGANKQ